MSLIEQLLIDADQNGEIIHEVGPEKFRIDLKPDDLRLWGETLNSRDQPCNLLLACAHGDRALEETEITWVVGSAIRSYHVDSAEKIASLMISLGVDKTLAEHLPKLCPGLGSELTWAFYLDRSGALSASPVSKAS
jgi:hypothetical protein